MTDNKTGKIALRFRDKLLEDEYQHEFYNDSIKSMRIAMLLAIILYALFGLSDIFINSDNLGLLLTFRFAFITPYLILVLLLTYTNLFAKYGQIIYSTTIVVAGGSISAMIFIDYPAYSVHSLGLIIVFFYAYNFSRLQFIYATISSVLVLILYFSLVFIIAYSANNIELKILHTTFGLFYLTINVVGLMSNFSIEKLNRESFFQRKLIDNRNQELQILAARLEENNQRIADKNEELSLLNDQITAQNIELSLLNDSLEKMNYEVIAEKEISEKLLLNILPEPIAQRLKEGETTIADYYESASVVFIDQMNFTTFVADNNPEKVVETLNMLFTKFDKLVEKHGLEKIKTIGDCYMAASGVPVSCPDHAIKISAFAAELLKNVKDTGFNFRIGIDCGPVIAGVIGERKFIYDLWGETVNIASRLESTGGDGKIHVSDRFKKEIEKQMCMNNSNIDKCLYKFEERGIIEMKGIGFMKTWWMGI